MRMNLLKTILKEENIGNLYSNNFIIQFTNCRIIRDNKLVKDDLWIRNGVVLDPEKVFFDEKKQSDLQIDCNNLILSPGFIDTQINGGFGYDFTYDQDKSKEIISIVSKKMLAHGVTAFCPTIVSSDKETYKKILPNITKQSRIDDGALILGWHLEGPFISKDKFGAHDVKHLRTLDNGPSDLHEVYGNLLDNVRIVTLAPELDPNGKVIEYLTKEGIIVSIGHSAATLEQGEVAFQHGARFITHLFNAMSPFHHRDPHLFGLLSERDLTECVYYGIIADGIHTHKAALNVSYKTHPKGLILVTDAVSPLGLSVGSKLHVGGQHVEVKSDKRAVIANTNTLCGSITPLNECIRTFQNAATCSLVEAVDCASEHPAKLLGIYPKKGSLNFGADADFVIIDEKINVYSTFINGDLVWSLNDEWKTSFKLKNLAN